MPKVMMIGKVSKLKSRTRRAGSFKGALGTVVLEGSRAKSRRYGMGNIAGSPAEHIAEAQKLERQAAAEIARIKTSKLCNARVGKAVNVLAMLAVAEHERKRWTTGVPGEMEPRHRRMTTEALRVIFTCTRGGEAMPQFAVDGVKGVRRRRRR